MPVDVKEPTVIGALITLRREQLELTTSEIGRAIGCTAGGFITMIEKGVGRRKIEPNDAPLLADVLKVNRKDLTKLALYEKYPRAYRTLFGDAPPPLIDKEKYSRPMETWDRMRDAFESLPESSKEVVMTLIGQLAGVPVK